MSKADCGVEKNKNGRKNYTAISLAITALFSALLSGGKLALAAIPNVEIVTILLAVCAGVFGLRVAAVSALIFVTADIFIWGFNTWVVSYYLYWPLAAVTFALLNRLHYKNLVARTSVNLAAAVTLTLFFGVITTAIDTLIGFSADGLIWSPQDFFYRFSVMYIRGAAYFLTHIVSNAAVFAVCFAPLYKFCRKMNQRFFGGENLLSEFV